MGKFIRTTAINKIAAMSKRFKIIQGGTSSSKTFSIIALLINKAIKNDNLIIDIVSCTYNHLEKGTIQDFKFIMKDTNRWNTTCWHDTRHIYTFDNGTQIRFMALDGEGKARGPRRNILFVNEANLIDFETFQQLAIRTSGDIYLDFNPTNKFYAHTEILPKKEAELIILTYKDNEALEQTIIDDLESYRVKALTSEYWKNYCNVYLDGQIGSLEGVIYNNWTTIDTIPTEARLIGYGMDFGYNDPTTLIGVYKYNNKLILDEVIYQKGLLNSQLAALVKQNNAHKSIIYADSADPKSIKDLQSYGIGIQGAIKGPDSIKNGIHICLEYEFLVTKHSTHLIEELEKYEWMKKGDTNQPIDAYNHCCDSFRYVISMLLGSKGNGPSSFPQSFSFSV